MTRRLATDLPYEAPRPREESAACTTCERKWPVRLMTANKQFCRNCDRKRRRQYRANGPARKKPPLTKAEFAAYLALMVQARDRVGSPPMRRYGRKERAADTELIHNLANALFVTMNR